MRERNLDKVLREAGLKENDRQLLLKHPELVKLVVGFISTLRHIFYSEGGGYRGKADLDELPGAVRRVQKRDGTIRDSAVAAELGITRFAFSKLKHHNLIFRLKYAEARSEAKTPHG